MTTDSPSSSWVTELTIKDLKGLVKFTPSASGCLERYDFENVVQAHYKSFDEAQSTLQALHRLQKILGQDRGVLNYESYIPSGRHVKRLKELRKVAPDLYDNPSITPRSKWFQHPMYRMNAQMPPFHVHFREELQMTLQYLYESLKILASNENIDHEKVLQRVQSARNCFHSCMRGLNGHVRIEEYACFPIYQQTFPNVDLKCLWEDHEELHQAELGVGKAFDNFLHNRKADDQRTALIALVQIVLDFDDHLMQHLGEEEELVVPLSLTEKRIHF